MQYLKLYAATALVFFVIDLVWIGVVASGFYQKHLGHLLAPSVKWAPALAFYAIYLAGLQVFAVLPGVAAGSLQRTLLLAAFLGFFAYATFDLTCMALFKDFPLVVVVVDMVWGAVLSATVCAVGYALAGWIGLR